MALRGDAAFAKPELYQALEERDVKYVIRLPANDNLERHIAELLTRPVGRPSYKPVIWFKSFLYQAASWKRARRVVAKVEFHFGELFPRVGFIVTNLTAESRAVVRFYNKRGTAEQWIKEGKQAVKMTRLSCHRFRASVSVEAIDIAGTVQSSFAEFNSLVSSSPDLFQRHSAFYGETPQVADPPAGFYGLPEIIPSRLLFGTTSNQLRAKYEEDEDFWVENQLK